MTWKDNLKIKAYRWNPELFAKKELPYNFSPPQAKIVQKLKYKEEDKVIITAAAGVGKTLGMACFLFGLLLFYPSSWVNLWKSKYWLVVENNLEDFISI